MSDRLRGRQLEQIEAIQALSMGTSRVPPFDKLSVNNNGVINLRVNHRLGYIMAPRMVFEAKTDGTGHASSHFVVTGDSLLIEGFSEQIGDAGTAITIGTNYAKIMKALHGVYESEDWIKSVGRLEGHSDSWSERAGWASTQGRTYVCKLNTPLARMGHIPTYAGDYILSINTPTINRIMANVEGDLPGTITYEKIYLEFDWVQLPPELLASQNLSVKTLTNWRLVSGQRGGADVEDNVVFNARNLRDIFSFQNQTPDVGVDPTAYYSRTGESTITDWHYLINEEAYPRFRNELKHDADKNSWQYQVLRVFNKDKDVADGTRVSDLNYGADKVKRLKFDRVADGAAGASKRGAFIINPKLDFNPINIVSASVIFYDGAGAALGAVALNSATNTAQLDALKSELLTGTGGLLSFGAVGVQVVSGGYVDVTYSTDFNLIAATVDPVEEEMDDKLVQTFSTVRAKVQIENGNNAYMLYHAFSNLEYFQVVQGEGLVKIERDLSRIPPTVPVQ